jgi:hypothetical protein
MSSDMASMQLLDPKRNQLRLLAWRGFHAQSAIFWEEVYLDSASTCGLALSAGCRVVVPDIEACDSMAGTPDLDEYRRSNIRAVQSTPLVSRSGQLLGMISTHWREPHQPTEVALRRLDVLARLAADGVSKGSPAKSHFACDETRADGDSIAMEIERRSRRTRRCRRSGRPRRLPAAPGQNGRSQ